MSAAPTASELHDRLRVACLEDEIAAIRTRTAYQPAAGEGTKVYPPTYRGEGPSAGPQYLEETRWSPDGDEGVRCVLLDGYASQANRLEEALLRAVRRRRIEMPLLEVVVDVDGQVQRVTSLDAPHRVADAIWRDSLLDGVPFYDSPIGRPIRLASATNALPLLRYYPTALVFGFWFSRPNDSADRVVSSHNAKVARAYASEIVAVDATSGKRPSSRIDPLGIQRIPVYATDESSGWTADPNRAAKDDKDKPKSYARKRGGDSYASAVGHSNIPPSVVLGGVTMEEAVGRSTLSFARLRMLEFPTAAGELSDADADAAARTLLSALALAADRLARRSVALRSGCELVEVDSVTEWVDASGATEETTVDAPLAIDALRLAAERASEAGVGWSTDPVVLEPAPRLVDLIRRSRDLVATTGDEDAE